MDSEDTTDVEKNKLVNEFYYDIALFMKDDELKVLNISDTGKFPCKFKNGLELIVINQPINNMNDFSIKRLDGKNILNVKNVNYNGKIVELNITISEDLKNMINLQWDSEFFEDYKVNIKNILLIEYNDLIETSITVDNVYTDNQGKEVIIDKSNYQSFFDILNK